MEVVLEMSFLALSNANFQFGAEKLTWRSYTTTEALPTTSQVKLIDKRKFAKVALYKNSETFVMHVVVLETPTTMPIYLFMASQVLDNPTLAALQWDKAPTKIPTKYSNYADLFSSDLAMELPKNTEINEHAIELIKGKQSPYGPIYALSPVELETLKAYIKTHLKIGFIRPSKSLAGAFILFDKKSDDSLHLYVDYQGLNNLTIKNWYRFLLIKEVLDCLGRAKRFTQLDLTSVYHQMRIQEGDE